MAKKEKDACPRCASGNISKATDSDKCYCQNCGHIYVPGLESVASRGDLVIKQLQSENYALKLEIEKLRKQVAKSSSADVEEIFD